MTRSRDTGRPDADDPQQFLVYHAEDSVIDQIGPRLRRWREVESFVESVLISPGYLDAFPDAPLDVALERRSRSARSSLAVAGGDIILIRDGSWNALTVLHELAHLVVATTVPQSEPHGPAFVSTELELVRLRCGFDQYGSLRAAFQSAGVRIG
ncbi:MAG: hypothetical protein M9952_01340 [Microthrixaceae bacterium]|nr:hypothetical protein [Microthrixaceae bacterium]MCO5311570.1 hypothetical protein [Microthrixaceae bacterium]HPB44707.1 hypothetical protein [Microthrixaceae bacterium]